MSEQLVTLPAPSNPDTPVPGPKPRSAYVSALKLIGLLLLCWAAVVYFPVYAKVLGRLWFELTGMTFLSIESAEFVWKAVSRAWLPGVFIVVVLACDTWELSKRFTRAHALCKQPNPTATRLIKELEEFARSRLTLERRCNIYHSILWVSYVSFGLCVALMQVYKGEPFGIWEFLGQEWAHLILPPLFAILVVAYYKTPFLDMDWLSTRYPADDLNRALTATTHLTHVSECHQWFDTRKYHNALLICAAYKAGIVGQVFEPKHPVTAERIIKRMNGSMD